MRNKTYRVLLTMALGGLSAVPGWSTTMFFSIGTVDALPGSSGSFDVLLTDPSATDFQNVAAFNFELTTTNTDLTFTSVTTATTAPYIFTGASLFGPTISTNGPGQTIDAGDVGSTGNGTNFSPGATYAVGEVFYTVSPSAVTGETATMDFTAYPSTSLSDSTGTNVLFTDSPGTLDVVSAVPEPAGTGLIGMAGIVFLLARRRFARNRQA